MSLCDVVYGWGLRARVWGLAPEVVRKRSRKRFPGGAYWSALLNFISLSLLEGGRLYSSTCHVSYVYSIAAAAASTAAAVSSGKQHRRVGGEEGAVGVVSEEADYVANTLRHCKERRWGCLGWFNGGGGMTGATQAAGAKVDEENVVFGNCV